MVPFVILMYWLYYRGGRSVLVAILFHVTANFGSELLLTHPDTRVIQTGLLLVVCAVVILADRQLQLSQGWKSPDSPGRLTAAGGGLPDLRGGRLKSRPAGRAAG